MSHPLNISVRQKIIDALALGSSAAEVAKILDMDYKVVHSVADENAPLITRKMVERTNRLARQHDSEAHRLGS